MQNNPISFVLENREDTLLKQKNSQPFFDGNWKYIAFLLLIVNVFYFFCYDPSSPYAFSHSLWYADFRYWSDWISGCCWLVFAWTVVSTLLALFIPKNEKWIFLLRRSFFQKVIGLLFVFWFWSIWYNFATLPLATIFKPITSPVTNWIYNHYTLPLVDYYTTGEGSNPMVLPIICIAVLIIVYVTCRILYYFRCKKRSKKNSKTITSLLLLACISIMLGADDVVVPPKKVETSIGIYDVKSKEDLLNFTTEQIRELVKMEDNRTKGSGKTPHPILVYCFEERSFQYTGGKYENSEIKYRLHVPQKIKPGKKYPLVVHLHGVGEAGKDNTFSLAHLHSVLPLM
ncbi:MAG: hypothetical protein LBC68_13525, partial [Prevotellaceae bacterium]|nr:hypothetical protein [Prevotellaceae bacterium]